MGFFSFLFRRKKPKKLTLGLALGSGGAKGFAELGALRAFKENGIEFDVIAGTSIGSIIGAFYADGYTSTDILELLKRLNFSDITSQFLINMDTSGVFTALDNNIGHKDIEDLKKPFCAIATNMDTGEEVVFRKGNCAISLCASSCYPPFFKPVVIDDKRYIDGAFTNSVPSDVVKSLGADYIVAIDLSNHEPKPKGMLSKIFPSFASKVDFPWEKGYTYADVMLHPNLSAYKPVSIGAGGAMYDIGYQCALKMIPQIKKDIQDLQSKKKKK